MPKRAQSLTERITRTKEGRLIWNQERAIFEITEAICEILDQEHITRSQLAARLEKSKGYITQLLDGATNMTVRTIADVFFAIGYEFHPRCTRIANDDPTDVGTFPYETATGYSIWNPDISHDLAISDELTEYALNAS